MNACRLHVQQPAVSEARTVLPGNGLTAAEVPAPCRRTTTPLPAGERCCHQRPSGGSSTAGDVDAEDVAELAEAGEHAATPGSCSAPSWAGRRTGR